MEGTETKNSDPPSADENKQLARQIGTGNNILHMMYTFGKHIGKIAIVYMFGYFNISPAWLLGPVVLSVLREEWGKEKEMKRNIAKAAAMSNEKEVILARVDDLPAWVFFPDIERAEWVNRILSQVWPNVNHYAKDLIKDVIEPAIRENLALYKFNGFAFQKMRLGTIPPRIGGVKVYDKNVSRNEIIMDMDIFYAGDCDISFTVSGLSGGIKDFQIHGMVRVVMKPLISTLPLVGGLQIYFLNNPTLDFNLVGMADLLDMPGLSDMLRKIIVEQVAAMMVLPNKLPILLSDAVSSQILKFPEPQGVLRVHVVEAKNLMKKDISMLGKGKSDPYAIVTLGAENFKTQVIDNTIDPKWDYWCEAIVTSRRVQELRLTVWDWDAKFPGVQNDDFLGRATVEVLGVTRKGQTDTWISLEDAKTGMIHLRMTWLQLSSKLEDLKVALSETQMLRVTSMSTAVLMVYVDSAKNLPKVMRKGVHTAPDPMFQISLAKMNKTSNIQYRTDCPVYEQGFTFLVHNPETDTLHIKFLDQKSNSEIGKLSYNLSGLLEKENLELQDQPLQIKSAGPESKVIVSMRLRILKYEGGSLTDDDLQLMSHEVMSTPVLSRSATLKKEDSISTKSDDVTPEHSSFEPQPVEDPMVVGVPPPRVESSPASFHRRQLSTTSSNMNLPLKDPTNIPDPYVKLYLLPERSKDSKRKTETVKDNCNPVYDETFDYVMSQGELTSKQLEVTVLTQKTWKSPVLGQVLINLADLDLTKAVTAWFDLQPEITKEKEL